MPIAHPLVFIGLGGTGGKILGVIQNTIARRLRAVGVHKVPAGIQFLHIDVPAQRDAEEGGYAFALSSTDYLPLTQANSTYSPTYNDLAHKIREARPFTSWAPLPNTVPEATAPGAAQIRAYGRVIALGKLRKITDEIQARIQASRNGANELNPALEELGFTGLDTPALEPHIVVISSLAGGSGAGLTPDVLDVLRTMSNRTPLTTLLAPDVFYGYGAGNPGWAPNSLATLCELIAQDYSSGQHQANAIYTPSRREVFNAQLVQEAPASGAEAYYLVGASSQDGTVFTRPQEVFQVMGSMYAELALNPNLLDAACSYLLTNYPARRNAATDRLGITSEHPQDNPNLMGLGFGRLSIGREFFAQYAHQRFLRLITDRLLEAHLDVPDSDRDKGDEILLAEAIAKHYPTFIHELSLNELDDGYQRHDQIVDQVSIMETEPYKSLYREFANTLAADMTAEARGNKISTAQAFRTAHFRAQLESGESSASGEVLYHPIRSVAHDQFMRGIPEFERKISSLLLELVPDWVAEVGLPVVIGMLARLRKELVSAAQQLQTQSVQAEDNAISMLAELEHGHPGMARSIRKDDYNSIETIAQKAWAPIQGRIKADELGKTSQLVVALATGLIDPWLQTLQAVRDGLDARVNSELPGGGKLKQIWPTENGAVPSHLRPSPVEFTLESVSQFPEMFLQQVTARMPSVQDDLDAQLQGTDYLQQLAITDAVRDLITGFKDDLSTGSRTQWTAEPVTRIAAQWVSKLHDATRARPAVIRIALTLEDIENRVIDWLNDPNAGTRRYLDCTLGEYLNPPADSVTDEELRTRHNKMVSEFTKLLQAAKPLVNLSQNLYGEVHGPAIEFGAILGSIDVPTLAPSLQHRLGTEQLTERLKAVMQQIMPNEDLNTGGTPSPSITMLTYTAQPFHLLVADSIMGPVRRSGDSATSTGWLNRRARPLAETVPLSLETQFKLLLGLFAGRLMGQVELQGTSGDEIRVRDNSGDWMTVTLGGLRPRHSTDPYRDYPGRFLEAYIAALVAASHAGSLRPLKPFQVVHELGKSVTDHTRPLHQWVLTGRPFPDTADAFLLQPAATDEERAEQLKKACEDLVRAMKRIKELSNTPDANNLATLDILELTFAAIDELSRQATIQTERF